MPTPYPGHIIKRNDSDTAAVTLIQTRLVQLGCGPLDVNGLFDARTEACVRLFQTRFPDTKGMPLKVDGEVGSITWGALFGEASVPKIGAGSKLAQAAVKFAATQVGVLEKPPGSNNGPEVKQYLASVGLGPGNAWCASFAYFCTDQAAQQLGVENPLPKTGLVLGMWREAKKKGLPCVTTGQALANTKLVTAGMLFVINHGQGFGHLGFVEAIEGGKLITVEGNSNNGGSREGIGVFRLNRRTIGSINEGFIGIP